MLLAVLVTGMVSTFVLLETRIRPVLTGPDQKSGHTEIYVADSASVADGVTPGETVAVHVVNRTAAPESYSWSLQIAGTPVHTGSLLLAPGESSVLRLGIPTEIGAVLRAQECGTWVRAKRNDSWTRLATRHDLGLQTLLTLNDANAKTFIGVGERICVGAPAAQPPTESTGSRATCVVWARAARNDSWTRFAARYEIALQTILALNNASVKTFIGVGERICVGSAMTAARYPGGGVIAEFSLAGKPQTLRWKVKES